MASLDQKLALLGKLTRPPIVESVIDIDCDMPIGFNLGALEEAGLQKFGERYPICRKHFLEHHHFQKKGADPFTLSSTRGLQALRFLQKDERQLVQVRTQGFSFNRLAPYSKLDDHLPEIERTYRLFCELTQPVQVRQVALRYINRIMLPLENKTLELDDYLEKAPKAPDDERFEFRGFLHQHILEEKGSGNQMTLVLTLQPVEGDRVPLLFDNGVRCFKAIIPADWPEIQNCIFSLRHLKNEVFADTLTERCLNLFQ
jgi:uncharacterized protein (TIGR04255 family)